MNCRDGKSKQALIEYLQKGTDERLWQAIANFGLQHGICGNYLKSSNGVDEPGRDLFFMEADDNYVE